MLFISNMKYQGKLYIGFEGLSSIDSILLICLGFLNRTVSPWISNGNEVIIDKATHADLDAVKLLLLNSVFAVVLLQRGYTPFWGSSVVYQQQAFVLLGRSAVGKSFLAAGLRKKGFQVLSENLCILTGDHQLKVVPGYPFLMLWKQALTLLEAEQTALYPVRPGLQKYQYPLHADFHPSPATLAGIYILGTHNKDAFTFEELKGFNKSFTLMDYTYNEPLVKASGMHQQQHKIAGLAANQGPIQRYTYLDNRRSAQQSIDHLAESIASIANNNQQDS